MGTSSQWARNHHGGIVRHPLAALDDSTVHFLATTHGCAFDPGKNVQPNTRGCLLASQLRKFSENITL